MSGSQSSDSSDSESSVSNSLPSLPFVSCGETEVLTTERVLKFFQLASNPNRTIYVPPSQPKGGEVYLYVPESSTHTGR